MSQAALSSPLARFLMPAPVGTHPYASGRQSTCLRGLPADTTADRGDPNTLH